MIVRVQEEQKKVEAAYIIYVCGFCFSEDKKRVVLIKKKIPEWQRGYLNGIGGKVEDKDTSLLSAMGREFKEEVGLEIEGWKRFLQIHGNFYHVHFYKVAIPSFILNRHFENNTLGYIENKEGFVVIEPTHTIAYRKDLVYNLRWIVPLALDDTTGNTECWTTGGE